MAGRDPHPRLPVCWRCATPLIYYALTSWYARTTAVKDRLLAENAGIGCAPSTSATAASSTGWPTTSTGPVPGSLLGHSAAPVALCGAARDRVESLADLSAKAGRDLSGLDPHRPFVDEVTFACPECGQEARRVPDVLDAWFDSGRCRSPSGATRTPRRAGPPSSRPSRPTSSPRASTRPRLVLLAAGREHPAVSTRPRSATWSVSGSSSTATAARCPRASATCSTRSICWTATGPTRCAGSCWPAGRRGCHGGCSPRPSRTSPGRCSSPSGTRSASSPSTPVWPGSTRPAGRRRDPHPAGPLGPGRAGRHRRQVTRSLDDYDATSAARRLAGFVDDLSNWSCGCLGGASGAAPRGRRRRLRDPLDLPAHGGGAAGPVRAVHGRGAVAGAGGLGRPEAPDSVHLVDWPRPDPAAADPELSAAMAEVRRLVASAARPAPRPS